MIKPPPPAPGRLSPGDVFGPRYRILRLLGAGGMGIVYHAWDEELGVAVALKVIRPEVSADPAMAKELEKRFKRELLLARKVSHHNVVRIHDIGEVDGIKYITMTYVDGRDLATILKNAGHLPVPDVLHLIRQLCAGLQEAHAAGVVHRDLKPANIMIAGEHLVIMDFGIARSVVQGMEGNAPLVTQQPMSRNALVTGATLQGAIVGTVAYMSPEQAKGQPADARSDIYAVGMIMRDMLVGARATEDPTDALTELMERVQHAPKPVKELDPSIPDAVDRLVTRCLQPEPAHRYQTVTDLLADLNGLDAEGKPIPKVRTLTRRTVLAVAVGVLGLVFGTWWLSWSPPPPRAHDPVSVLIADLQNGTGDPSFDHALEPMLKLALEGAGFITAFDRTAVARSLGVRPPERLDERAALQLAVKQGLGVVLSGSIDRQGDGYGISVKATQAVTGTVIATTSDRAASKDQVLGAATTLANSVREALGDEMSESAKRFATQTFSATSWEVVRQYATAAEALSRSKYEDALQTFSKAVALDPNFGLGYAGMAIASRNLDRQQDAEKHIKEAVRHLDGMTERERYRTRGLFYFITGDYQACVKEYGDLIARYAADAPARNNLALCLTYLRELPRAVGEMQEVIKILPKRTLYRENLATVRCLQRGFSDRRDRSSSDRRAGRVHAASACVRAGAAGQGPRGGGHVREGRKDRRVRQVLHGVGPRRSRALRRPLRGCCPQVRRGGGRGSQVRRPGQGREQVRRPCLRRTASPGESRRDRGRREGAGQQQGSEDPVPCGACLRRERRRGQGPHARGRPRRGASRGAAGVLPRSSRPISR